MFCIWSSNSLLCWNYCERAEEPLIIAWLYYSSQSWYVLHRQKPRDWSHYRLRSVLHHLHPFGHHHYGLLLPIKVHVIQCLLIMIRFNLSFFTFTFAICYRPSVCRLSVCNVPAPYSSGSNFRQYFYGVRYLSHPLKISRRSSQGNPSAWGVKHKRGSQI